jgi:hypothetical protein
MEDASSLFEWPESTTSIRGSVQRRRWEVWIKSAHVSSFWFGGVEHDKMRWH